MEERSGPGLGGQWDGNIEKIYIKSKMDTTALMAHMKILIEINLSK